MYRIFLTGILSCLSIVSWSQVNRNYNGSESKSMGNIQSISNNCFAVNNNPSYLTHSTKANKVGFEFNNRYNLNELNTANLVFSHVNKINGFGISFSRFGGELLKRQYINLTYAHAINGFSIGFRNTIQQLSISENGTKYTYSFDVGSKYIVNNLLEFGFLVTQINRVQINNHLENIPSYFLGAIYKPTNELVLLTEFQKIHTTSFTIATEYKYKDVLKVRIGLNPNQNLWTAGLEFLLKEKSNILIAYQLQETLGSTYSLTVHYKL